MTPKEMLDEIKYLNEELRRIRELRLRLLLSSDISLRYNDKMVADIITRALEASK